MILLGFCLTPDLVKIGLDAIRQVAPRLAAQDDVVRLLKMRGWVFQIGQRWVGDGTGRRIGLPRYTVEFARCVLCVKCGHFQSSLLVAHEDGHDLPDTIRLAALEAMRLEEAAGGGGDIYEK